MNIWAKRKNGRPEKIEENVPKREIYSLLEGYQMAFGPDFVVWAGLKRDEPNRQQNEQPKNMY